jgi:hypothetical protein
MVIIDVRLLVYDYLSEEVDLEGFEVVHGRSYCLMYRCRAGNLSSKSRIATEL